MINKIIVLMLVTCSLFSAEQKTPETSTLVRPATPGAPKMAHRHLAITIDRDSPLAPVVPMIDLQPNRLKFKLAIVGAVSAVLSAGITATVTILSKKC